MTERRLSARILSEGEIDRIESELSSFEDERLLNALATIRERDQRNILDLIMGVDEAGQIWGLSPDHVKRLCQDGKVECKKIGKTWVLVRDQPNPKRRERSKKNGR